MVDCERWEGVGGRKAEAGVIFRDQDVCTIRPSRLSRFHVHPLERAGTVTQGEIMFHMVVNWKSVTFTRGWSESWDKPEIHNTKQTTDRQSRTVTSSSLRRRLGAQARAVLVFTILANSYMFVLLEEFRIAVYHFKQIVLSERCSLCGRKRFTVLRTLGEFLNTINMNIAFFWNLWRERQLTNVLLQVVQVK